MTIDERLEALTQSCELLLADSLEHSKRFEQDGEHIRELARIAITTDGRLEALKTRHEALTQSCELLLADSVDQNKRIDKHSKQLEQDGEHIRTLARIAELHHLRLVDLEGGPA